MQERLQAELEESRKYGLVSNIANVVRKLARVTDEEILGLADLNFGAKSVREHAKAAAEQSRNQAEPVAALSKDATVV